VNVRYVLLIYDEVSANASPEPPDAEAWERMVTEHGAFTRELSGAGAWLAAEALQPIATATTVRVRDGRTVTTDGPFAETKEGLGGFYLIEAPDLDAALEWAAKCPGSWHGTVEVRPVVDLPPYV
jgi:hypothetical protein